MKEFTGRCNCPSNVLRLDVIYQVTLTDWILYVYIALLIEANDLTLRIYRILFVLLELLIHDLVHWEVVLECNKVFLYAVISSTFLVVKFHVEGVFQTVERFLLVMTVLGFLARKGNNDFTSSLLLRVKDTSLRVELVISLLRVMCLLTDTLHALT